MFAANTILIKNITEKWKQIAPNVKQTQIDASILFTLCKFYNTTKSYKKYNITQKNQIKNTKKI